MTIEQTNVIDFTATDRAMNEVFLVISDHLPWDVDENGHLRLLQDKLNKYLGAIESGEFYLKCPQAVGRKIVIYISAKYNPSPNAQDFIDKSKQAIRNIGYELRIGQGAPVRSSVRT